MAKRAVLVFTVLCALMCAVSLRIVGIINSEYAANAAGNNTKSMVISDERAPIYDRNGNRITNAQTGYIAAVKPGSQALSALSGKLTAEELEDVKSRLEKGYPVCVKLESADVFGEDIKVIPVESRYSSDSPAAHLIGYTGADGHGVAGIEKSFDSVLDANRRVLSAVFDCDAYGRVIAGADIKTREDRDFGDSGVYLTLDLDFQRIVQRAMEEGGVKMGAAVVLEIDSGAVRAMASVPAYNQNDVAASLESDGAPFVNRALSSFAVGSVFKPAIAAAALEQGIGEGVVYECDGSIEVNGREFGCYNHNVHGRVDMRAAIERSCNAYFINLAQKLDKEQLINTLSAFGFGTSIELCEGIASAAGSLPKSEELDSPAAVANLSFGQGSLLATPLQVAAYISAIAAGGVYRTPYILERVQSAGETAYIRAPRAGEWIIGENTAKTLAQYLKSAVENGNGSGAKPDSCTAAGKTATAQTGVFQGGEEVCNTWFAGWFPAESPRYAVVIMKERGDIGASDCAPVFKAIADEIMALNREN